MTGRAAGHCAGYPVPGYMNPIPGRRSGFGRGPGYGRGMGWGRGGTPYAAPYGYPPVAYGASYGPTSQEELALLKGQTEHFEGVLDGIRKRIQELEAQKDEG